MLYVYSFIMVGYYVLSAGRATVSGPRLQGEDYGERGKDSVWRVLFKRTDVFGI